MNLISKISIMFHFSLMVKMVRYLEKKGKRDKVKCCAGDYAITSKRANWCKRHAGFDCDINDCNMLRWYDIVHNDNPDLLNQTPGAIKKYLTALGEFSIDQARNSHGSTELIEVLIGRALAWLCVAKFAHENLLDKFDVCVRKDSPLHRTIQRYLQLCNVRATRGLVNQTIPLFSIT